ncbi:hypothetical protein DSM03_1011208 [Leeuwenhoekiella aestuarii]|uniref:Uncharacterized protein n=1 Tax=Leeuwenhoekiella aestuarii TaxID=2249426 RepID=A0A4Q0P2T4_9FLAO|nr:hypothetical protein DSM04_101719 [Leeuwenhoekiella aestuarii]RXG19824.1 hypothetical protein DSM03_1011208 [Leeuwenhoekiella aestuarii]
MTKNNKLHYQYSYKIKINRYDRLPHQIDPVPAGALGLL